MTTVLILAAALNIDPVTTRWTFGAHEPYTMYRRVGRHCTGSIDGNALWVKDWLDWFDEHAPEKMEEVGLNFLHSRFYKGMGWEVEKKDFPNVQKFVRNCHAHGVKALAYVQFCTLYPEFMRREIPNIDDWATVDWQGNKNLWGGQYFRWTPCLNCREWEEYIKRMCTIALTDGGFDGIMFDNVFDYPCYCARCERTFREHLARIPEEERLRRFGFADVSSALLPRISRSRMCHLEAKDPVFQEWALWRCGTMNGVMSRFRAHIKSVKPDAIVSGNPSPYRSRARFLDLAQNMSELCKAFDFIIMQNTNFPDVKGSRIYNRVRDLKFAQDLGQRIVALCDTDSTINPEREAKFLMPMVEDVVFGGVPTDRTIIVPSPEPGFLNKAVFERRKRQHAAFDKFAASHRAELSSPTMHPVRIFYPEREVLFSEATHQGVAAAEEIFLRNHVPYGYLVAYPDEPVVVPDETEVIVVPGLVSLSDAQMAFLVGWAKKGGKLVVTGDSGRYDDWNAQRRENPLLPRLKGFPNVVLRESSDLIAGADLDWCYSVDPPADGGKALVGDLAQAGWAPPVRFEGLPPHVFAEYRRLGNGKIAVHLVNYVPEKQVEGARIALAHGESAEFEEPLCERPAKAKVGPDGALPKFGMYAVVTVATGLLRQSRTLAAASSLQAATIERVFRPERHSRGDTNVRVQQPVDEASWIWAKDCDVWGGAVFSETRTTPEVLAKMPQSFFRFRRDFTATGEPLEIDVSADERFVLLLDGEEIARGPMRGLPNRWNYQSYRISNLKPGAHRLEAICWQVGEHAPLAQVSIRGGFIVKAGGAYDGQLTTGKAEWKVAPLGGTRMTHKGKSGAFGVGSQCEVRGTGLLDEVPDAGSWSDAVVVRGPVKTWAGLTVQGWKLFPSPLKDMMRELKTPGAVKRGFDALKSGAVVPANTKVTAWWDLGNYYCAYPCLSVSGGKGARVSWDWAECLTGPDGKKGDRAAFEGLDMHRPFGDVFLCDGRAGARFSTPWWRCGRWCRLTIETADEPLAIDKVEIAETRYPVEMAASFDCDDKFVMKMQPVCARVLQMCMHEMFFDCPYYEQQMYPGDSRVQYLVSGLFDTEDRIVRNAINLYDADRRENGQISMNCPTRGTQDALGFTCCEAMMFGDYAWNHANRAWLKAKLPGLNHTLMGMDEFAREDGLLGKTPGWNFVDWVSSWKGGVPPDGDAESPNAEMNLQYLHAMLSAVIAEDAVGDAAMSAYWRARAERLKSAIKAAFWCEDKSLFASNVGKTEFSEHSQCLALLADVVAGDEAKRCFKALVETPKLARGTIYYKHYLFATYFKFRRADLFFGNLGFWRDCLDWNLSTILETPETNSRSDCHGWGSHPLWHLHTGVAGVKSAAPFYEKVLVEPQPAHLKRIRSTTPTPRGDVKLDLSFDGNKVTGSATLPEGLFGTFRWDGKDKPLSSGRNDISAL